MQRLRMDSVTIPMPRQMSSLALSVRPLQPPLLGWEGNKRGGMNLDSTPPSRRTGHSGGAGPGFAWLPYVGEGVSRHQEVS